MVHTFARVAIHPPDAAEVRGFQVLRRADGTPWLLRAGSLGPAWKAQETSTQRMVVLTALPRACIQDADVLRTELQRMRAASHPNLVELLALVAADDGALFLVSEWTGEHSLLDLVRRRQSLAAAEAVELLRLIAAVADHTQAQRFAALELGLAQIRLHFPEPEPGDGVFDEPLADWPPFTVKVKALPMFPADADPALTRASSLGTETPAHGTVRPGSSLALLACELFGRPLVRFGGGAPKFSPIAGINEAANEVLRRELSVEGRQASAAAFVEELARAFGLEPRPPTTPTPGNSAPKTRSTSRQPAAATRSIRLSPGAEFAWGAGALEASRGGHRWIEPEHLLLGLLALAGEGAPPEASAEKEMLRALWRAQGVQSDFLRDALRRRVGRGEIEEASPERRISRSLASKAAFYRAARLVGSDGVLGAVDLLAAMLEGASEPLAFFLRGESMDPLALVKAARTARSTSPGYGPRVDGGHGRDEASSPDSALARFGRDLTALARAGELHECLGRDEEMLQLVRALGRQTKSNPLLVGEAGVGKTALVEGLAWRISQSRDATLAGRRLVEISVAALVAGTGLRGELESRVRRLLEEAAATPGLLLFIDEVHTLVGGGRASGTLDLAELFKPALARGTLRCVGATTPEGFREAIEPDPALARRFQPIRLEEPSPASAREILERGFRARFEEKHGVRIEPGAVEAAVTLSVRYLRDRRLPDKAIDLLDDACSRVAIPSLDGAGAGDASDRVVSAETVAEALAASTHLPVARLGESERVRLQEMPAALARRVIGQEPACRAVAQAVQRARTGLRAAQRPLGVLLLAGPTGVGKTELAKATAEFLFGSESALLRFDMSEYASRHEAARLVGAPPGYVGHDEEGQLTGALRRNPFAVVLLDEFEKAHPEVLNLFLQLFDEGRLTDAKGRSASATEALFLLTSNAEVAGAKNVMGFGAPLPTAEPDEAELRGVLSRAFRPELVSRLDAIIPFRALNRVDLGRVAELMLEAVRGRLKSRGVILHVRDEATALLVETALASGGNGRAVRRAVEQLIEAPVAELLVAGDLAAGGKLAVGVAAGKITLRADAGSTE